MAVPIPPLDPDAAAKLAALGEELVILDTNVVMEIVSIDLVGKSEGCETPEELRRSAQFRCRQLRARYSNLLAWHLAGCGRPTLSIQDEGVRTLTTNVAPRDGGLVETFTEIIVHHVLDGVFGASQRLWLRDDECSPKGNDADRWLVYLASLANAPLITNEGVTPDGISDRKKNGSKTIRAWAAESDVSVYAPSQYLEELGVHVHREALAFVDAVTSCLRSAVERGAISGRAAPEAAARLVDVYRFVMLDEVDDQLAGIKPPAISWAI
jgi:hypothetical protein